MNKGVINIAMKGLFLFSNMSLTKNFTFYSFFVNYVDTANLDCALKVFMCMGGSQELFSTVSNQHNIVLINK